MMLKVINVVAVTLLVALVSIIPGALLAHYLPELFNPSLQRIAVAAWLSGLISWWIARAVNRHQREARGTSKPRAVGVTVAFLAVATGIVVVFHFYGDGLLG